MRRRLLQREGMSQSRRKAGQIRLALHGLIPISLATAHLLLIEDDVPLRPVITRCLRVAGHERTEAGTAREGLARFRYRPPDLVITDLVMPDQDGLGVLMELREISPVTPVIVISSRLTKSRHGARRCRRCAGHAAPLGSRPTADEKCPG